MSDENSYANVSHFAQIQKLQKAVDKARKTAKKANERAKAAAATPAPVAAVAPVAAPAAPQLSLRQQFALLPEGYARVQFALTHRDGLLAEAITSGADSTIRGLGGGQ